MYPDINSLINGFCNSCFHILKKKLSINYTFLNKFSPFFLSSVNQRDEFSIVGKNANLMFFKGKFFETMWTAVIKLGKDLKYKCWVNKSKICFNYNFSLFIWHIYIWFISFFANLLIIGIRRLLKILFY